MKKIIKYSKKNDEIKKIKKFLFKENSKFKKTIKINNLFKKQKKK